ncbi:hypothetical protein NQ317_000690 [Molorchus minor]|uniref:G-protein coupled receptors family 1 profile domain-containing protein n=1 Tax=Molorchus minor TaxID=1323400 RepID=A0ABQ9JCT3_9CUCU|nr:hypothetical protein NQ317_000690 [Molorchus minor]
MTHLCLLNCRQIAFRALPQIVGQHWTAHNHETNSNYEPRERLLNERLCLWRGMIRTLGVQQTNEVKATQNLSIIVLFFMICWIPLYTINCILAFRPDFQVNSTFMLCCIILSHLNSAGNPLLYAYHLRDFRAALKHFFCGLFNHRRYCERINRNTNYGQCTSQLRAKSRSSNNYNFNNTKNYKRNLLTSNKMSVIVKKTTDVASATAGEVNGGIWNISENSASSSDSMKSLDSHIQEKILMIRPATPYRPRNLSEINPVYMITTCEDESDDGFNEEETLPRVRMRDSKNQKIVSRNTKRFSFSSPQISDELFVVEDNVDKENNKTVSLSLREPKKTLGLSVSDRCSRSFPCPFKVVNILRSKKELCRSLSDGGSVSLKSFTPNGKVKFTDS